MPDSTVKELYFRPLIQKGEITIFQKHFLVEGIYLDEKKTVLFAFSWLCCLPGTEAQLSLLHRKEYINLIFGILEGLTPTSTKCSKLPSRDQQSKGLMYTECKP